MERCVLPVDKATLPRPAPHAHRHPTSHVPSLPPTCLPTSHVPSPPITHSYAALVRAARDDASGAVTQARSVNGHLVYSRAGFAPPQVTAVLRRAVAEHGRRGWWEVG